MTELKTLKEIELYTDNKGPEPYSHELLKDKIKQEAIEWIKEITSASPMTTGYGIEYPTRVKHPRELYSRETVNWIEHFFNIKEKDIK